MPFIPPIDAICSLREKHAGQPVAILGGGPSLLSDVAKLPAGSIYISVNHHAAKYFNCDYMVYLDRPGPDRPEAFNEAIENFKGLRVCPVVYYSDVVIDLHTREYWQPGFSAGFAAWLADYMGAGQILLCGMDCYQGKRKYFYDRPGEYSEKWDAPLEPQLAAWRPALDLLGNADRVKAVSGPLVDIFGRYDPNQKEA